MQQQVQQAIHYMQSKQYEKAINACNKIISSGVRHPQLQMIIAIAYAKTDKFTLSQEIFNSLVTQFPQNAELHYNYALALQDNNQEQLAISHYETCMKLDPNNCSAINNIGIIRLNLKQSDNAKLYFEKALLIQPNNIDYLRNFANACYVLKQYSEATTQLSRIISTGQYQVEDYLMFIDSLYQEGDLIKASKVYNEALVKYPNDAAILNFAGLIEIDSKRYKKAKQFLDRAIKLEPGNLEYSINQFTALSYIEPSRKKLFKKLKSLIKENSEESMAYEFAANLCENRKALKEAKTYISKGLTINPKHAKLIQIKGRILAQKHKYKKSLKWLEKARISTNDIELKANIAFDIAKYCDKKGDFEESWNNIITANQLAESMHNYATYDNKYITMSQSLLKDFIKIKITQPPSENPLEKTQPNLIFIVGFPRSGTTLIERILMTQPKVKILEETNAINEIYASINQAGNASFYAKLFELSYSEKEQYRDAYINNLSSYIDYKKGDTVIDKMPMNGNHLALIHEIFPHAKIIFSIRHPADVCLSSLMQDMLQVYSMTSATEVYDAYMQLVTHYTSKLKLKLFKLKYEDLITDMPTITKNLYKFLDLSWSKDIENFHSIQTPVNTPSYQQVSQPIYQDSKYRYKNYLDKIDNETTALDKWIKYFGYSA